MILKLNRVVKSCSNSVVELCHRSHASFQSVNKGHLQESFPVFLGCQFDVYLLCVCDAEILMHFQSKDTTPCHQSCSLPANVNKNSPYQQG